MVEPSEVEKFLRAAVRTGLRMQRKDGSTTPESGSAPNRQVSDGVATLQKIKASLNKRKTPAAKCQ
jgi:hypothetical protein